jgi:endonuclease G
VKFLSALFLLIICISGVVNSADFIPKPAKDIVRHTYYTLSYNEKFEQANWVYYSLTDSMVINGGQERSNKFKVDKMVSTGSAKSADYTKSGFDRGHLCPAADMDFNPVAMEESFLMSNISPQVPEFNRGIWKDLETDVRKWAEKEHKIHVVVGPVFADSKGTIGEDKVLVPGSFYKIIYEKTDQPKIIAFLLPNSKSDRPLTDFAVTVDDVEKATGFDFFSQLPDELESRLENHVDLSGWFEGYTTSQPIAAKSSDVSHKASNSDGRFYLILISVIVLVIVFVMIKGRKRR